MQENGRTKEQVVKDSHVAMVTYREVKAQIIKKAKSSGLTMSRYLEDLVLRDLHKDGVSITIKAEKKII